MANTANDCGQFTVDCLSHNRRNGNDPVLDLNVYVIDVDCCWWKHIINDIFLTDSQRERDKIVKMTKTLNDPSVFTLRVWETLSTICQEIFFRPTQIIYIFEWGLRKDENGSTVLGHFDLKDTSPQSDPDVSFDQFTHHWQNSEMISGIIRGQNWGKRKNIPTRWVLSDIWSQSNWERCGICTI